MKKLKKVLSLVLVVAMLASMLIVGAAAAETEETLYPEAVTVMSGIGVIEGDEGGLRPTDTVTREEAAKIIAYVLLGDTAETLPLNASPFADVASGRWSAGYIAYLKGQGVINGVTDTTFDPTAEVTGVAFAKMLLTAVGYGKAGEFEGADWDINTITYANQLGLFAGTKAADLTAPATREECMLYAFNALTGIPTVSYNKTFEAYYTGTSALDPITGDVIPTATTATSPYAYTLAWKNFDLKQTVTGTNDDFGRPAASWVAEGVVVAEAVANIDPTAVLYGAVRSLNLYNTLGKTVIKNLNDQIKLDGTNDAITVYVDGVEDTGRIWTTMVAGEYTNTIGGTGATVELYLSQNTTTGAYSLTVVAYYEHLGEITRVNTAAGITTLTIKEVNGATVNVNSEEMDVAGFAKKDMVKYTAGAANGVNTVATLAVATPVVGTYNNYNSTFAAHVIDGAFYSTSAVGNVSNIDTFGNSYSLYLDSFGNMLYAELYEEGESANQYVYVADVEAQAYVTGALKGQEAAVAVTVLYPNGGKEVLYYAIKNTKISGSTVYYITVNGVDYAVDETIAAGVSDGGHLHVIENDVVSAAETALSSVMSGWMRYTINDAKNITLKALNSSYASTLSVDVDNNRAAVATGYTANSATVLTLVDGDGNAVTYTGIKNFVDITGSALVTYGYESKIAKTITLVVPSISTSMNLAYCAGQWQEDETGDTYMFYVDGVMQFINTDSSCAAGYIYDIQVSDGVYTATLVGAYSDTAATTDAGTVNAGYSVFKYGAANQAYYGDFSLTTYTYSYYEWATIDSIDDNYFTTVAVEGGRDAENLVTSTAAAVAAIESAHPSNTAEIKRLQGVIASAAAGADVSAEQAAITRLNNEIKAADGTDYLTAQASAKAAVDALAEITADTVGGIVVDANTYYFDANTKVYDVSGGTATEISEGDVFVAYVDEAASVVYNGAQYVSHIWIVG